MKSKVENEMLSVKMRLTKAIRWSQVKSGDDAAEKLVSNEVKKTLAEATQLLKSVLEIYETLKTKPQMRKDVHQIKRGARCWRSHRSSTKRTGRMTTTN